MNNIILKHLKNNPWKINIKNITKDIIKFIAWINKSNKINNLIYNIIVGINEKFINHKYNNIIILSLLYGLILDISVNKYGKVLL